MTHQICALLSSKERAHLLGLATRIHSHAKVKPATQMSTAKASAFQEAPARRSPQVVEKPTTDRFRGAHSSQEQVQSCAPRPRLLPFPAPVVIHLTKVCVLLAGVL